MELGSVPVAKGSEEAGVVETELSVVSTLLALVVADDDCSELLYVASEVLGLDVAEPSGVAVGLITGSGAGVTKVLVSVAVSERVAELHPARARPARRRGKRRVVFMSVRTRFSSECE